MCIGESAIGADRRAGGPKRYRSKGSRRHPSATLPTVRGFEVIVEKETEKKEKNGIVLDHRRGMIFFVWV